MSPSEYLKDSDWSTRSKAISFRQLMHLDGDPKSRNTFTSTSAAYPPTPIHRTYGGHVIAQAAFAACHTVPFGLHVHSITGYFLSLGDTRWPFRYVVRRTRDGGVYSVRTVDVYQDHGHAGSKTDGPMFVAIVGLKRDEARYHEAGHKKRRRDFGHQILPAEWLQTQYDHVLGKRRFENFAVCQGMDGLWPEGTMSADDWKRRGDVFPGLEMRKVDTSEYNGDASRGTAADDGRQARDWRCLLVYRFIEDVEETLKPESCKQKKSKSAADDDLNIYACAHIYASDRNSLFTVQRALGLEKFTGQIGSLSHTVNFHGEARLLHMIGENGRPKEFVQESWASASGDDRVCHESRIWDRETGRILASTIQDGMMRIPVEQNINVSDGEVILRRMAKL